MTWDDCDVIGAALATVFADANHLTIGDAELIRLVTKLPDFSGPPLPPDPTVLSDIGFAWIAALSGPDDSGPYDGLV